MKARKIEGKEWGKKENEGTWEQENKIRTQNAHCFFASNSQDWLSSPLAKFFFYSPANALAIVFKKQY